ncbi:MAG: hypothetical protein AAGK47_01395 [Bacteroidota bacterium]
MQIIRWTTLFHFLLLLFTFSAQAQQSSTTIVQGDVEIKNTNQINT